MTKKLNCAICANFLLANQLNDEMFEDINRGGLTVPSDILIDVVIQFTN